MLRRLLGKRKSAKKPVKRAGKKKPFGGYSINFAGREETMEEVFGKAPLAPSQMTKKIWVFIKKKRLSSK